MVGTAIAIAVVFAAAALAVRSAAPRPVTAGVPGPASSGAEPSDEDAEPSEEGASPAPAPDPRVASGGPPSPADAPTITGPIPGLPVPAADPVAPGPVRAVALLPPASSPRLATAPVRAPSFPGVLGVTEDRTLADVLAAAAEIEPAGSSAGRRLAIGIGALSFAFATGALVVARGITLIVHRLLH